MCLVGLRIGTHPGTRIVLVANRDEFHARPSAPADFWPDAPEVLGGRDLEAGGSWLGVTRGGRWAAVTNFRAPDERKEGRATRGALVHDYLVGTRSPSDFAEDALRRSSELNAYNLLLGAGDEVVYASSVHGSALRLAHGDHVLSNHLLDTPWPKTRRLADALRRMPDDASDEHFLSVLADREPAPDGDLPDTGVGLAIERVLSPVFIATPAYGTRASSLVRVEDDGRIVFVERSFDAAGTAVATRRFELEGA